LRNQIFGFSQVSSPRLSAVALGCLLVMSPQVWVDAGFMLFWGTQHL